MEATLTSLLSGHDPVEQQIRVSSAEFEKIKKTLSLMGVDFGQIDHIWKWNVCDLNGEWIISGLTVSQATELMLRWDHA